MIHWNKSPKYPLAVKRNAEPEASWSVFQAVLWQTMNKLTEKIICKWIDNYQKFQARSQRCEMSNWTFQHIKQVFLFFGPSACDHSVKKPPPPPQKESKAYDRNRILTLLRDISCATDQRQRQAEGSFKQHETNHRGVCVQRAFDQSRTHLTKSPNIEKSPLRCSMGRTVL